MKKYLFLLCYLLITKPLLLVGQNANCVSRTTPNSWNASYCSTDSIFYISANFGISQVYNSYGNLQNLNTGTYTVSGPYIVSSSGDPGGIVSAKIINSRAGTYTYVITSVNTCTDLQYGSSGIYTNIDTYTIHITDPGTPTTPTYTITKDPIFPFPNAPLGDKYNISSSGCTSGAFYGWYSQDHWGGSYGYPTTNSVKTTISEPTIFSVFCGKEKIGGGACNSPSPNPSLCIVPRPQIAASPTAINCGSSSILTATGCNYSNLVWSTGETANPITVSPETTTSYTAKCIKDGCGESQSSESVTITVTPIPKPTITATNLPICKGTSTTLSASCEVGTVQWSTGETTGSITVTPTETTTYFAHCVLDDCISDDENKKIDVIKVYAPSINSTTSYLCGEGSVFVRGICGTGTINWTAGGGSGSSFTQYLTATNIYKGVCTDQGCSSDETSLTIPVLPTPDPPSLSANKNPICAGQNAILTATGCTQQTLWSTGDGGTTITVSSAATYKARCIFQSCPSVWQSITITINSKPPTPNLTANPTFITTGQSSTLTANNCTGTIVWSASPSNSPLPTGNGGSVSPSESTRYKIKCKIGDCESDESSALVIVNNRANPPSVNTVTIKSGQEATLTATNCAGGIAWYNTATGGNILTTGFTFTTPILQNVGTYTYYASCFVPGAPGFESLTRAIGTITVMANPCLDNPNQTISQAIFEGTSQNPYRVSAANSINATSKVGSPYLNAVVEFKAGNTIILNAGFKADNGTVFVAQIGGCN